MNNAVPEKSPATDERVNRIARHAETLALKEAGKREVRDTEVRKIQQGYMERLLEQNPGTDGATANGADLTQPINETPQATEPPAEMIEQGKKKVDEMADVREAEVIPVVPDAKVKNYDGTSIAGTQQDETREIGVRDELLSADSIQRRRGLVRKIMLHEDDHRKQETGNAKFSLPPTGNPEVDATRTNIRRLAFRERSSIKAEGGPSADTTDKYMQEYWNPTEAIRRDLNVRHARGNIEKTGDELVEKAGYTAEGFRELYRVYAIDLLRNPPEKDKEKRTAPDWQPEFSLQN